MTRAKTALLWGVAITTGAVSALGILWLQSGDTDAELLRPSDTDTVALGIDVYATNCAACHGVNLEGQPNWQRRRDDGRLPAPPHDETGHTWHHSDELLFDLTKYGVQQFAGADYDSDMPAYEGILSDDEIIAVLSYIKSTWPEEIRTRHDKINEQSAAAE